MEHLNRCKTSTYLFVLSIHAGGQSHVCSWLPNEEGRNRDWNDSLGRWGHVPAISSSFCRSFFIYWIWRPAKPRTGELISLRVSRACHNLVIIHFEVCTFAATWYLFTHWFIYSSLETIWTRFWWGSWFSELHPVGCILPPGDLPYFINCTFLGFSSRRITTMIQFLSSVISMVSPTRCHGHVWGNPL